MYMDAGNFTERYLSAGNSQDLTAKAGREDDVDALAAVAWNRSRIGAALLRLKSQWDGAAKRGLVLEAALPHLSELHAVRSSVVLWAIGAAIPEPEDTVAEVLAWWLTRVCAVCSGTQWQTVPGKPKRPCKACRGTGGAHPPRGNHGRDVERHLEQCLYKARASIKGRMAR